jgi:putative membrane protein insertion efficiency factor
MTDDVPVPDGPRLGPMAWVLTGLVRLYQLVISPWLGPSCRFEPSCSAYAVDALRLHGGVRGSWLVVRRLARCQPFCAGGYDPVPEPRRPRRRSSEIAPGDSSTVTPVDVSTVTPVDVSTMTSLDPAHRVESSEVGDPVPAGSLGRGAPPC